MILLKCRCLLIWGQIVFNQQHTALWNWIRGRFQFYFPDLPDRCTNPQEYLPPSVISPSKAFPNCWSLDMALIQKYTCVVCGTVTYTLVMRWCPCKCSWRFPNPFRYSEQRETDQLPVPFIGRQTRKPSINNGRLYSSRRLSPFGLSQSRHRRTVAPHSGRIRPSNANFLALSLLICKNLQEKTKTLQQGNFSVAIKDIQCV